MANVADVAPVPGQTQAEPPARTSIRGLFAQTEIDLRLFGMLVALVVILVTFNILSGGTLIQPTNMITMAVQAAGIAIIATGMVLVIVSRNIDLSVGSLVGLIAMSYALWMTDWFPRIFGIGPDVPFQWVLALALGIGLGAGVGAIQGFIIAYIGVPSFIVTLGGLLSIRGLVWYQSQGAAVIGLDPTFQLFGGGALGSVGELITWILGVVGCVAIVGLLVQQPASATSLWLPDATDVGRGAPRRRSAARSSSAWPGSPTTRSGRRASPTSTPPITASRQPPGGLQIPVGFPFPIVAAHRRDAGHDASSRTADGSAGTCTPTAATPTPPSWPASTRAGRSSRPTC